MNFRTPLIASIAVLSALGGVAAAAIALPSSPPKANVAAIVPSATPTPEVRTETVRRTIHVVQRDKTPARPVATASPTAARSSDDSGHHSSTAAATTRAASRSDDSGHHSGRDDSGHHGGGDDSGSSHGRGRGRGGDDD